MIIRIYNPRRSSNQLVGFMSVNKKLFHKVLAKDKLVEQPNQFFYRAFRKQFGYKWHNDFAWRSLTITEIETTIEIYEKKVEFYNKQLNFLKTLSTLQ